MDSFVDPDAKVGTLDSAEKAIVAIARALAVQADLLVLDEPTASLSETDVSRLLVVLKQLQNRKLGIIFVTHRIDEVFRIADTVTVLRDGKRVDTRPINETTPPDLVEKITGRRASDSFVSSPKEHSNTIQLRAKALSAAHVAPVSFEIARGEILALVGLRGSGHEVVGRMLFGDVPIETGELEVNGRPVVIDSCLAAIENGIGYVSSKRIDDNLAGPLSVLENLYLNSAIRKGPFSWIQRRTELSQATELLKKFSVRPLGCERVIMTLSGGNQQKVILARWISLQVNVLILEEPTGGVDVGAKAEIYRILGAELDNGLSILLISSDYEEVIKLSHRALVFNHGHVVAELSGDALSVQNLTSSAAGTEARVFS